MNLLKLAFHCSYGMRDLIASGGEGQGSNACTTYHFEVLTQPLGARITLREMFLYHFRDRSIPALDEILDAKLSEVQDHMRTLMQKQVRVWQPPWLLLLCCYFDGHLLLGVTEAAWTISKKQFGRFESECMEFS